MSVYAVFTRHIFTHIVQSVGLWSVNLDNPSEFHLAGGLNSTETMTSDSTSPYEYTYYYDYEICNRTEVFEFGAISTAVFFSIVFVLSLMGNILVLAILLKYENIRSVTNTLILNLAVSDLLFTTSLPFWIYYDLHGWTLGEPTCKLVNWVFYTGFCSSSILLVLMTVHRYVAVMNPLSNIVSAAGFPSVVVTVVVWAQTYAFYISRMLAFSHCCLNPVFYVLVGVKFKNHLKKMLRRCTSNSHSIPNRPSRNTILSVTSEELSM
ncbi:hypothetical protein OJAV_G00176610 [Oryzias javanicus]|uniref:G-protein coupled receptors family 1 profile domain-containing protein n=1 Tax=Oryzias javanicus TaxID=123683 RepID=A0A437CH69_ORYJA|nr:hypothetical protein OJAV_G00176610 [Oryzias javanicus]